MWNMFAELLTSKKALAAVSGVIIAAAARYGLNLPEDAVNQILAPIVAYIVGQGLADFGKGAKTISASPISQKMAEMIVDAHVKNSLKS